ncbi:MAG: M14 family metallopeptidase [Pseudomonadota bacterium]|nr:M14 family metallopeptidase [Pseudomonadota bacterium]
MLQELHTLPDGLLETDSRNLETRLGAPTLIHLPGEREPPLFVSVLMHGNETVGWEGIRTLLQGYLERFGELRLPRALSLFIGNTSAAAAGVRRLPGQPDYNRVWPGTELPHTPEHTLMQQVVNIMSRRGVFASVDIHNNTGCNPHYGCVNLLDNRYLHLATLFSRTVVYFIRPRGVQSIAMAELCPAVTLECGKVGEKHGTEHAREYLNACLHLSALPEHPVALHDIDLFHTVAQVKVPEEVSFGFPPEAADILFTPELERLNFRELPGGTPLGRLGGNNGIRLDVRDEQGRDVNDRYFHFVDGELRLKLPVMPSMLTRNEAVIRQDCLCYLMERFNDHLPPRSP